jgi:hypothetical protein
MAAEFKLNPGASEFVPCFAQYNPSPAADTIQQMELNIVEKCCEKQVISSTKVTPVQNDNEYSFKGSPVVASNEPELATKCLVDSHNSAHNSESLGGADLVTSNIVRTSSKDSSAKCSSHTLPRIASGEQLVDMELDFHEMILQSPCDKEKSLAQQDDLNPLQIWCGEEPPQLVWSRSAEDFELPADNCNQEEELSGEQTTESCNARDAECILRSQKQSKTSIAGHCDQGKSISSKGEEQGESNCVDPVPHPKSKITVDDFEILCMVGEV